MKVLVQNAQTGKFLTGEGFWEEGASSGHDFRNPLNAISVAKKVTPTDFRLVFYFPPEAGENAWLLGAANAPAQSHASV